MCLRPKSSQHKIHFKAISFIRCNGIRLNLVFFFAIYFTNRTSFFSQLLRWIRKFALFLFKSENVSFLYLFKIKLQFCSSLPLFFHFMSSKKKTWKEKKLNMCEMLNKRMDWWRAHYLIHRLFEKNVECANVNADNAVATFEDVSLPLTRNHLVMHDEKNLILFLFCRFQLILKMCENTNNRV